MVRKESILMYGGKVVEFRFCYTGEVEELFCEASARVILRNDHSGPSLYRLRVSMRALETLAVNSGRNEPN
jgi:hypothetical protein